MTDCKYISKNGIEALELLENLKYAAQHNVTSSHYSVRKTGREQFQYIDFIKEKLADNLNQKVDAEMLHKDFQELLERLNNRNQFSFKLNN